MIRRKPCGQPAVTSCKMTKLCPDPLPAEIRAGLRNRIVEHAMVPASEIKAHADNWRVHSKFQREAVMEAIEGIGWIREAIINKRSGNLIDGHLRALIAFEKNEAVPVCYVDLSEEEERDALLLIDPLSALAGVDRSKLLKNLAATHNSERIMDVLGKLPGTKVLAKPGVQDAQGAQVAQAVERDSGRYNIGRHVLIVGDALNVDTSEFSVDGVCTDPPYELDAAAVCAIIGRHCSVVVMMVGDTQLLALGKYWHPRPLFIWHRKRPRSIPGDMQPQRTHQCIVVATRDIATSSGWRRPYPAFKSVIELDSKEASTLSGRHGHEKPSEVVEIMLSGFLWETVCDPFAGSGATILACEATGRRCIAIERSEEAAHQCLERCRAAGLPVKGTAE